MIENIDRVPVIPNRKLITPEGGTPFYATITYADEATEDGTPISKQKLDEMLSASGTTTGTASALVLSQDGFTLFDGAEIRFKLHIDIGGNCTINCNSQGAKSIVDINNEPITGKTGAWLTAIYSSSLDKFILQGITTPSKIGEIKPYIGSSYNIPAQTWSLCNGEKFSQTSYSDLFSTSTSAISYDLSNLNISGGTAYCIFLLNSNYIVGGLSTIGYPCIWHSTTLTGAFTQKIIYTSSGSAITRIKYVNGYYFIYGFANGAIYWCDSLSGTWLRHNFTTGGAYDVTYNNGYWMVAVKTTGSYCYYSNNLSTDITLYSSMPTQNGTQVSITFFLNGEQTYAVYTNNSYAGGVAVCTNPNSWTYKANADSTSNMVILDSVVFGSKHLIFTDNSVLYGNITGSSYRHFNNLSATKYLGHCVYDNILYIHLIKDGKHCVYYCNDDDMVENKVFTIVQLDYTVQSSDIFGFNYNGVIFTAGGGLAGTVFYGTSFVVGNAKNLPILTATDVNYFIRML